MRTIFLLAILFLAACRSTTDQIDTPVRALPASVGQFITQHTEQVISISQDIHVSFSGAVVSAEEVGKDAPPGTVVMRPKVPGRAYWRNMHTVVFEPEGYLDYNRKYTLRVQLHSLFDSVPEPLRTVDIDFKTRPLSLSIKFDQINYDPTIEDEGLSLRGRIRSSDYVDTAAVEKILSLVRNDQKKAKIIWTHHSERSHGFEIVNIERGKEASSFDIRWDGGKVAREFKGSRSFDVHPQSVFKLLEAQTSNGENRSIALAFSDPIDKRQDLTGLIRVNDQSDGLTYDIVGSTITVYLKEAIVGRFQLRVDSTILRANQGMLDQAYTMDLSFDPIKPAVRLSGKGVIVPHSEEVIFPFEAVNLHHVHVEVFKVFQDNVLQFLQYNQLSSRHNMAPVGRIVHQEHVDLRQLDYETNSAHFTRYALDLQHFTDLDPGSIYQIRIGFTKADVIDYPCEEVQEEATILSQRDGFTSILRFNESRQYYDNGDPCTTNYYHRGRFVMRNVLASNFGAIAKRDRQNRIHMAVTDLRNLRTLKGVSVTYYDFQQQAIQSDKTGADGMAVTRLERKPSFAVLQSDGTFGYVNLQDQFANSTSEFDVSGKSKRKGIDGRIYAERGVWRPGDTLFLNFVLEDKEGNLPAEHPVRFKVVDARGKVRFEKNTASHVDHVYHFPVPTKSSDATGNWRATARVGNHTFQKTLKVETIKPNRLKIRYDESDTDLALHSDQQLGLNVQWLHGASADGLKAEVEMQLRPVKTKFSGYKDFAFDDPARKIDPLPITIFSDRLDADGRARIPLKKQQNWQAPGKLRANFRTKAYEKGGNFSEDNFSQHADLYASYVGINVPKTRWGYKHVKINTPTSIPLVVVDAKGQPIKDRKLAVGIYEAEWRWWYDRGHSNRYKYNSAQHHGALSKASVVSGTDGRATYDVEFQEYGNYMIRVCDEVTGHCTGDLFYTGSGWRAKGEQEGPQQLIFTANKASYRVGEDMEIRIPSNEKAKIFLSIENGEEVLQAFWLDAKKDETVVRIPTDRSMNSNIYVHASLVQQHNHGENDLPLRMYGVVGVSVIDPASQLSPVIDMPDKLRPNENYALTVSEAKGQPMAYTIAVVDEGLLDLTRFKTPDLWKHFYGKQALGVKTWDLYDLVLNNYGGEVDRFISIGGDAEGGQATNPKEAQRFKPVVRHLGPFYLEKGAKAVHRVSMPNYVGSVRAMVVARNGDVYGSTDKTVPVKKPLMVLATLPRVLGPSESLSLPANVFAMEDHVRDVDVLVKTSDNLSIEGPPIQRLRFDKTGDQQAYFNVQVGDRIGPANVRIDTKSGAESSFESVDIQIRNPNPYTSSVFEGVIEPGETWTMEYEPFGTAGSNEGVLEVSQMPPMNYNRRLKYLIRYPYGCIEQTTSSAFPQLFLSQVMEITPRQQHQIDRRMRAAIERLALFQISNGAFAYWPGQNSASDWGSTYAGHFLLEAKERGYYVPERMIANWIKYQKSVSDRAELPLSGERWQLRWPQMAQAYRLYTLARSGEPNLGAMNRLRHYKHLSTASAHMLAAAYALVGKQEVARRLLSNRDIRIDPYIETGYTFGSHVRDMAMMAEANQLIGNGQEAAILIKSIGESMSSSRWYSTQTTAYALLAVGKFLAGYEAGDLTCEAQINGGTTESLQSGKPMIQQVVEVDETGKQSLTVKNTSSAVIFTRFVLSGQLPPGARDTAHQHHVSLDVKYTDLKGEVIDPSKLRQGTDFVAAVTVQNRLTRGHQIRQVALSQIFPSGWEIQNLRLSGTPDFMKNAPYTYRDIRDDRVYTFFDMNGNRKLTFSVLLHASYAGKYYLPPVYVEAMYDNEIQAKNTGQWIEVLPSIDGEDVQ